MHFVELCVLVFCDLHTVNEVKNIFDFFLVSLNKSLLRKSTREASICTGSRENQHLRFENWGENKELKKKKLYQL